MIEFVIKPLLNLVFLIISFIIRREKNIWIVGGWFGERFADNSRYFFFYLTAHTDYRVIWLSKNKRIIKFLREAGYEAYHIWELKGLWLSLKARYHVVDQGPLDVNPFTSFGAIKVNLWHGFPLKKIGYFIGPNNKFRGLLLKLKKIPYIGVILYLLKNIFTYQLSWFTNVFYLGTSDFSCKIISKAFNVRETNMLKANYPRNEFLLGTLKNVVFLPEEEEFLKKIEYLKKKGKKVICYFPTFRDSGKDIFLGSQNETLIKNFFKELNELNIVMVAKFHWGINLTGGSLNKPIFFSDNVIYLNSELDVYPFLKLSDALITDYSSVYFDYLWLNKPILFYPYDYETYLNCDRGFIFDYEEFTPGPKAYDLETLEFLIKEVVVKGYDSWEEARKELRAQIFSKEEGSRLIIEQLVNFDGKGKI